MNDFANAVGIDVSKEKLDAHDYVHGVHIEVKNSPTGFQKLIEWMSKNNELSTLLICFEHTGIYSLPLAVYLNEQNLKYAVESALQIKKSQGISRGKNDKVDAKRIAEYAYEKREKLSLYQLPSKHILDLKNLLSLRERMVSQRSGYQAYQNEIKAFDSRGLKQSKILFDVQEKMIRELSEQIQKIEREMEKIIKSDDHLNRVFKLATSVKGVGLVLGITMLVYTNCFTSFTEARDFACYAGIAPFVYESGTSIKGKTKVHWCANKRIKALLTLAASSNIQHNPEMKLYYQRRLEEGKNKMSVINIVRNKIVARVFAVVNRGTEYVDTLKYAA